MRKQGVLSGPVPEQGLCPGIVLTSDTGGKIMIKQRMLTVLTLAIIFWFCFIKELN